MPKPIRVECRGKDLSWNISMGQPYHVKLQTTRQLVIMRLPTRVLVRAGLTDSCKSCSSSSFSPFCCLLPNSQCHKLIMYRCNLLFGSKYTRRVKGLTCIIFWSERRIKASWEAPKFRISLKVSVTCSTRTAPSGKRETMSQESVIDLPRSLLIGKEWKLGSADPAVLKQVMPWQSIYAAYQALLHNARHWYPPNILLPQLDLAILSLYYNIQAMTGAARSEGSNVTNCMPQPWKRIHYKRDEATSCDFCFHGAVCPSSFAARMRSRLWAHDQGHQPESAQRSRGPWV